MRGREGREENFNLSFILKESSLMFWWLGSSKKPAGYYSSRFFFIFFRLLVILPPSAPRGITGFLLLLLRFVCAIEVGARGGPLERLGGLFFPVSRR